MFLFPKLTYENVVLTGDPLIDAVVARDAAAVAEADDALQRVGAAGRGHQQRSAAVTLKHAAAGQR